ncbi:unnamed protein product [Ceutorhynchus assimilis]|uniref:Uncharacterized protein n=1 Tax=Ceutorhynchus assimilis TaxID=467358 RepID=A0A9N9MDJ3_9CUCU|nr:unnamed protein product [Ceutorhynchus assimilis]
MKFAILLGILSVIAMSQATPAVPIAIPEGASQPIVRISRAPADEAKIPEKDLEGSETAYAVYPYYQYPYYGYHRYPYYVYGR